MAILGGVRCRVAATRRPHEAGLSWARPLLLPGADAPMTTLLNAWNRHRRTAIGLAVAAMVAIALYRLGFASARLLFNYGDWANIDIRLFHGLVHAWFAGEPLRGSVYPPATYALLWPFLGWLEIESARWLWAMTSAGALGWLARIAVREGGPSDLPQRLFLGLIPFAMYATSATIGNGQLALHVMPPLIAGTLLVHRRRDFASDCVAAGFILLSLVKPTVSAPFFWVVVFCVGSVRPAAMVVGGYLGLTGLAALLRDPPLPTVVQESIDSGVEGLAIGSAELGGGFANLHDWLTALGLAEWNLAASLVSLGALGIWVFRHRGIDPWILLGVSALVSRFWAYHRLHDDLVIIVPMIALFRIAQHPGSGPTAGWAGILLIGTWAGSMVPAGLLFAPPPIDSLFEIGQTAVWASVLGYLLWFARGEPAAS